MYSSPQCRGLAPLTASITNPCKQRMKFSCDTFFNVYRLRQQEHCNEFLRYDKQKSTCAQIEAQVLSRPQIATFNWIPSARRALLFANRALLSNLYFHFVLLHDTRNMLFKCVTPLRTEFHTPWQRIQYSCLPDRRW